MAAVPATDNPRHTLTLDQVWRGIRPQRFERRLVPALHLPFGYTVRDSEGYGYQRDSKRSAPTKTSSDVGGGHLPIPYAHRTAFSCRRISTIAAADDGSISKIGPVAAAATIHACQLQRLLGRVASRDRTLPFTLRRLHELRL
jgi:hypothetical protein